MLTAYLIMSAIPGVIASARSEHARWDKLTPKQREDELRLREVQALERLAKASENTSIDVHHHFF